METRELRVHRMELYRLQITRTFYYKELLQELSTSELLQILEADNKTIQGYSNKIKEMIKQKDNGKERSNI